jgi:hypothetical protein
VPEAGCKAHGKKERIERMEKAAPEIVRLPPPGNRTGVLKMLGGSMSDDFNNVLANQIVNTLWLDTDPETRDRQFQAAFAALIGIKPADEIEGMLAAQMVATHNAAMGLLLRLKSAETNRQQDSAGNLATKLLRAYAMQVEALQRYRGKGQQKVTVEHVHVHSGGQAIVGAVQGGGVPSKTEDQPHAPSAITHEPGIPMRGTDSEREAVPVVPGAGKTPL